MAYEVTATRMRPQTFDELVGQEFVVATLKNSVAQGRVAHAYLFSGPRGVGKTSAARILAKALNCERGPTDSPCGTCPACAEIAQGNSLDVIEIDGASNTSVNDVREIKDEVLFAPNSGRYKIYIIDEVHMLSNSAFNALLKTIEEPPPYIVFVFATTEVHKVPATIRSRCQQFNFRLIGPAQIKEMLSVVVRKAGIEAEDQALAWIAKEATGSLRDGYTLLDQVISFSQGAVTLQKIREKLGLVGVEEIAALGRVIARGEVREVLQQTAEVLERGVSVDQFATDLTELFRDLLLMGNGIRAATLLSFAADLYPRDLVEAFTRGQLEKALELLLGLHRSLRFSMNQRFELELVMSQLAHLKEMIDPAEILREVESLKQQALGGAPPSRPSLQAGPSPQPVPAEAAQGAEGGDGMDRLLAALRREKLALAASLSKAISWGLQGQELALEYREQDRFSGEHVLKERETVLRHAAAVFEVEGPLRLKVHFQENRSAGQEQASQQVEMVKKIFRGEIVEGEQ